jgi:hypothetical protein
MWHKQFLVSTLSIAAIVVVLFLLAMTGLLLTTLAVLSQSR